MPDVPASAAVAWTEKVLDVELDLGQIQRDERSVADKEVLRAEPLARVERRSQDAQSDVEPVRERRPGSPGQSASITNSRVTGPPRFGEENLQQVARLPRSPLGERDRGSVAQDREAAERPDRQPAPTLHAVAPEQAWLTAEPMPHAERLKPSAPRVAHVLRPPGPASLASASSTRAATQPVLGLLPEACCFLQRPRSPPPDRADASACSSSDSATIRTSRLLAAPRPRAAYSRARSGRP